MKHRTLAVGVLVASLAVHAGFARAQEAPAIDPKEARVLLLPVQEKSGRKGQERDEFIRVATESIRHQFTQAGFSLAEGDVPARARELGIDLEDEEQRTRANFAQLGKTLNARLVVASTIHDVGSGMKVGFFASRNVGKARVEFAVYDVAAERYIVKDFFTGQKRSSAFAPGLSKSSSKRTGAIVSAFGEAVGTFLETTGLKPAKK